MNIFDAPMNLTVRHLQMLVAVADLQSFSRAAERMGISQPAFSEAIRKIEEEVGYRIFDRTTRSLEITADGRHIVTTAREIVRDFRIALESIRAGASSKGPITIAALPTIVAAVMPSALKRFSDQFPDIHVAIHDLPQERALAMVVDGIADIGITNATGKIEGLHFTELASDQFLAIITKRHELQSKTQVRWKDLAAFPFIALSGLSSIRGVTDAAFIQANVAPNLGAEVEQIPSAVALVEAGYGVTALPSLAQPLFKGRNVAVRRLIQPLAHRRIGIVTLSHRKLSPAALLMANVLEDCMKILLNKPLGKHNESFHPL
jgi:DNA-binding transcriptional LysR family regulator